MATLLSSAKIITTERVVEGDLLADDGQIAAIGKGISAPDDAVHIHCDEGYVIPGIVDLHVHGTAGLDMMQAEPSSVLAMAEQLAAQGVTAFLPTTAGRSIEAIEKNCAAIVEAITTQKRGARIMGIHVEGPYFNRTSPARGANNPEWLRDPDPREAAAILEAAAGELRLFDLAPELPQAQTVTEQMLEAGVVVAAAHTDADFMLAEQAFDWGITHLIHTFNGMRRIHHREPGVAVASLLDDRIWLEVIADGQHLHPRMVELVFRLKGSMGMGVVTDATKLAGCEPGEYDFIGTKVIVEESRAYLKDQGTLAGSIATGIDLFNNLLRWGWSPVEAGLLCSSSPANHMGWGEIGAIEIGRQADLVCVLEGRPVVTIIRGEIEHQLI